MPRAEDRLIHDLRRRAHAVTIVLPSTSPPTVPRFHGFTASALIAITGVAAAQSPAPPRYAIREDSTGTNIRREAIGNSAIPLNRRYEDMTAEQQAVVKSQYEGMGEADEPPFPANGLAPLYKAIHQVQGKLQERGSLTMFVEVGPDGQANSVAVLQSPDAQLTRAVASLLMLTRYKPALCQGQPCTMQFPLRVSLRIAL